LPPSPFSRPSLPSVSSALRASALSSTSCSPPSISPVHRISCMFFFDLESDEGQLPAINQGRVSTHLEHSENFRKGKIQLLGRDQDLLALFRRSGWLCQRRYYWRHSRRLHRVKDSRDLSLRSSGCHDCHAQAWASV
jgi:hypothetical protein